MKGLRHDIAGDVFGGEKAVGVGLKLDVDGMAD
jgi:hypothetical protein